MDGLRLVGSFFNIVTSNVHSRASPKGMNSPCEPKLNEIDEQMAAQINRKVRVFSFRLGKISCEIQSILSY